MLDSRFVVIDESSIGRKGGTPWSKPPQVGERAQHVLPDGRIIRVRVKLHVLYIFVPFTYIFNANYKLHATYMWSLGRFMEGMLVS
jgi:hypothetical protein